MVARTAAGLVFLRRANGPVGARGIALSFDRVANTGPVEVPTVQVLAGKWQLSAPVIEFDKCLSPASLPWALPD